MTFTMRPNSLLKRAHTHTHTGRQTISNLLHSRGNSPHPTADVISAHKPIEEETLPKYNVDSFFPARIDDVLVDRYKLVAKLGFGMTATVWLAKDLHASAGAGNRKYVTIKININTLSEDYLKGRRDIAQKLFSANPKHPGYNHIRFMLDTFKVKTKHGEHLCIVYDVLREPIDICMEKFPNRRFSSIQLRVLLPALLKGLDYLHTECRVVHTDLKADNIMMGLGDPTILDRFVQNQIDHPSPRKAPDHHGRIIYQSCSDFGEAPSESVIASAKITDIGLAAWGDEKNTKPIQSNAFMAPEVILQCGWSYPADIWNLGVMLYDLIENFGLFDSIDTKPGHYKPEKHLGLMISLLGPPPKELLSRSPKRDRYFDAEGNFKFTSCLNEDCTFDLSVSRLKGEECELFLDFVKKMLTWLPEDRWTAKQLLDHPYITKERDPYVTPPTLSRASTLSIPPSRGTPLRNSTPVPTLPEESSPRAEPAKPRALTPTPSSTSLATRGKSHSMHHERSLTGPKPEEKPDNCPKLRPTVSNANKNSQDLIDAILKKKSHTAPPGIVEPSDSSPSATQ